MGRAVSLLKIDFTFSFRDTQAGKTTLFAEAYDPKKAVKEVANSKIKNANPDDFATYLAKRKAADEGRVWTPASGSAAAAPVAAAPAPAAASNAPYDPKKAVKEVANSKIKNANPDDFATYLAKRKAAEAGVAWYPGYK